MALKKTIVIAARVDEPAILHNMGGYDEVKITSDTEIPDVYIHCTAVNTGCGDACAYFEARTGAKRDGGVHICNLPPVSFKHDRFPGADEITTQAYTAAKKKSFYAGAEDC